MSYEAALERSKRARAMRSFYEPAWFGEQTTSYTDPLGFSREVRTQPLPPTMGGFTYVKPSDAPTPMANQPKGAGLTLPPEVLERIQAEERARKTRAAYSAPAVGPANLANYGTGALQGYGVGALQNYGLNALRRR